MIRTIIVDDEAPAISKMSYLLSDYPNYQIVGSFTNTNDLIMQLDQLSPQVAFLDIAMPGTNGIELAQILLTKLGSSLQIVFVTAYEEYAVTAFSLYAADYLLKPIRKERFQQTITRLNSFFGQNLPLADNTTTIMVRCFGKMEITGVDGFTSSWRTAKVRELFALFIQHRPDGIYRETLLDTLWEELPKDKALANLNTCNYYLRKFLEKSQSGITLVHENGYYSLNLGHALCDSDLFRIAEKESLHVTMENLDSILNGVSLYRGKYFEDVKCTWANLSRVQYDIRYANVRVNIAEFYAGSQKTERSNAQLILAINTNPLCEQAWLLLLKNYLTANDTLHYNKTLQNRSIAYQKYGGKDAPELNLNPPN